MDTINSIAAYTVTQAESVFKYKKEPQVQNINETGKIQQSQTDEVILSQEALSAYNSDYSEITLSEKSRTLLKIRGLSENEITRYSEILKQSEEAGDSKTFLKSLSADDRSLLKKAASYGVKLTDNHIDSISEEGAQNLIVQPDHSHSVDLNNDGVVEVGAAKMLVFPPPNSPQEVKDAWEEISQDMSGEEQMSFTSTFLALNLQANVKMDSGGNVIGFYEPGDEGYVNIYATEKEGWNSLLNKAGDYLEFQKKYAKDSGNMENIEWRQEKLTEFLDALEKSKS